MRICTARVLVFVTTTLVSGCASELFDPLPSSSEEGDSAPSCLQDKDCSKKPNRYCKATVDEAAVRCGGTFTMKAPGQCTTIPSDACTKEFQPVCGCDGKVYSNGCLATRAQTQNRNVSEEAPKWAPAKDTAALARTWQTSPITLPMGKVVLRYVFAKDGQFDLQMLDAAHMDRGPASTKSGTYALGPKGALELVYPGEHDGNGASLTGELALEQICADGFRISGHDGLPNMDVELRPAQ